MADYSGDYDKFSITFDPKPGNPNYWWSNKEFGEVTTRVPRDYFHLLTHMWIKRCKTSKVALTKPKITLSKDGEWWILHGQALSMGNRETEKYLGWENPCTHERKMHNPVRGYDWCRTCNEIFCDHPRTRENMVKYLGDEDWQCQQCGTYVDLDFP